MAAAYSHLSFEERALLETQLRLGIRPSAIAAGLLRARSTISREMRRNGWKADRGSVRGAQRIAGGYRSIAADRRARHLAATPRVVRKLGTETPLWAIVAGHLQAGDRIIGKGNRSQVGTLVERTTLFVALVQLDSTRADTTAQAFTRILNRFDSQMRRSMTYDQGSEMRHHKTLTANTGVDVYFAHPHAPWERGISENTNGLLRQYLPKGTDLSLSSQVQLDDIAWKLNTRPRKSLAWKAPAELFLPEGPFDFLQHWSAKITPAALGP